ncbi:MAG: dihydrodipicolinate synthase family protein [Bacteroidota bacterium]
MVEKLTGLIAAPHTPMHSDGRLHLDVVKAQAALLRKEGVRGVFIGGTTGEGASLTFTERKALTEAWASVTDSDLALIVHVGHNALHEACALAEHAKASGAHATAALAPSFFKPADITTLVDVCATIARVTPDLPFYYYHIPSMTGVALSMPDFLRVAGPRIPNLAGIKFSTSDLMQFRSCLTLDNSRYTMFFGSDEMLLGAMAMGATGAVGSTYNYAAPNYVRMIQAYEEGDIEKAGKYAGHAVALVEVLIKYGVMQAGKAIMQMRGVNCGPVRLPLKPLSSTQKGQLFEEVRQLGIFKSVQLTPPEK